MTNNNDDLDHSPREPANLNLALDRDLFLRQLIGQLAELLEEVIGTDDAAGFVSLVGQQVGEQLNHDYRGALGVNELTPEQLGPILTDLKRRIQGDFYIISQDSKKLVLGNHRCPFGPMVEGRPSLCMMTANVFGTLTAENLGYAKVALNETIAEGSPGCRVTIYLNDDEETETIAGMEYFRSARD